MSSQALFTVMGFEISLYGAKNFCRSLLRMCMQMAQERIYNDKFRYSHRAEVVHHDSMLSCTAGDSQRHDVTSRGHNIGLQLFLTYSNNYLAWDRWTWPAVVARVIASQAENLVMKSIHVLKTFVIFAVCYQTTSKTESFSLHFLIFFSSIKAAA